MSEQTRRLVEEVAPKEIDRADVLGELEHRFRSVTDDLPVIGRVLDELVELDILRYRERADDPKVGELRREDHEGGHSIWQVQEDREGERFWRCTFSTASGNRGVRLPIAELRDLPVVGSVPGTPAAEAEKPAPREVSMSTRQRVAELLVRGEFADAVNVVGVAWTPWDEARAFVKSMPEYRTGENHRPVEDVPLPAQDRVFQSDGPAPPEDVTVLHDSNAGHDEMPYLVRVAGGWRWSPNCEASPPNCGPLQTWREAAGTATGDLWEVV